MMTVAVTRWRHARQRYDRALRSAPALGIVKRAAARIGAGLAACRDRRLRASEAEYLAWRGDPSGDQ